MPEPTYVFDDDGTAYAYLNGKIVASAKDVDELEQKLAFGDPTQDLQFPPAPQGSPQGDPGAPPDQGMTPDQGVQDPNVELAVQVLQQSAPELLADGGEQPGQEEESAVGQADLPAASPDTLPGDSMPPRATHVETPNGLKGQILGTVKGLWGDQVTIRLENGRIAKFDVSDGLKYSSESSQRSASSPIVALQARLDELPDGTRHSLLARVEELKAIKREAGGLVRAGSASASSADTIILYADQELHEVHDALEALDAAEPYAPPEHQIFEQESVGGNDSSWLDDTLGEMITEAENTDFDQLMEEGPGQLAAEVETPALQDAEGVQMVAAARLASVTTGLDREAVADFKKEFLSRVEEARKAELETREETQVQQRQASVEEYDGPDEGLFL